MFQQQAAVTDLKWDTVNSSLHLGLRLQGQLLYRQTRAKLDHWAYADGVRSQITPVRIVLLPSSSSQKEEGQTTNDSRDATQSSARIWIRGYFQVGTGWVC